MNDILALAQRAMDEGGDPYEILRLLSGSDVQDQFGTPGPAPKVGPHIPYGQEFDNPIMKGLVGDTGPFPPTPPLEAARAPVRGVSSAYGQDQFAAAPPSAGSAEAVSGADTYSNPQEEELSWFEKLMLGDKAGTTNDYMKPRQPKDMSGHASINNLLGWANSATNQQRRLPKTSMKDNMNLHPALAKLLGG